MEQFRRIGEVLGSLRALMVFRDEIDVNSRQCCLLVDAFNLGFDSIADEIKSHLRSNEIKLAQWKSLEQPLAELHRIYQEGELYVQQCYCSEPKHSWWGKAIALNGNTDCVELHLHNLLWCIPVVLEAIENVAEATGSDEEEISKNRLVVSKKYEREWMDPKVFQLQLGKLYLSSQELCCRMSTAWKEDRWILSEAIADKKKKPLTDPENRLAELLLDPKRKLFPSSILVESPDFRVLRRIGAADSNIREIQWMGESFAAKHVNGDLGPLMREISLLSSVSHHPNVMRSMFALVDEEKKEGFMVMELMSKDLSTHIKDICSEKKKAPFPLLVAVDAMLQIARGMEYLHSQKIYHGDLNPSNILVKPRSASPDGYFHVKITGLGTTKNSKDSSSSSHEDEADPCIWYGPEVLLEQEKSGDGISNSKCTDKADIYSFAMICFELLTGKVPFGDDHLQGDKMSKNIRAGERPLFPSQSPKYMTNLTKRCWHADPSQRPSFSSICRVLRYSKRFLVMNPEHNLPPVDYFDLESSLCRSFASWSQKGVVRASEVPFQMYAYRVLEREKTSANAKDKGSESGSEAASVCGDDSGYSASLPPDDAMSTTSAGSTSTRVLPQISVDTSKKASAKNINGKLTKQLFGFVSSPKSKNKGTVKPPADLSCGRSFSMNSGGRLQQVVTSSRRRRSGHVSDSELT
ncbi:mitogen-activated protein kinase kinase kinase 7 [Canna indica]|uniref:Mitogen-activated protein kinase kinase kinase 7 n=1 Tax=Canna indica TaxID=4628 RepID=A0AAQ3Q2Q0_9LILI|nr:mitogen-activated protein kinase kinase kinase 7 [Canna indica]